MPKNIAIVALAGLLTVSIALGALAQASRTASVEIRVWEDTRDAGVNYISARPEGGSWSALGTIPIPLDGVSGTGRFRYGDITLDVPLPDAPVPPPATGALTDGLHTVGGNVPLGAYRTANAAGECYFILRPPPEQLRLPIGERPPYHMEGYDLTGPVTLNLDESLRGWSLKVRRCGQWTRVSD